MNDDRPKWLRGTLAMLAGWWSFWFCLIIFLGVTFGVLDLVVPGHVLPVMASVVLAVVSLAVSIIATVKLVKLQDRFLSRYSLRTNYIILAVLFLVSLVAVPGPFLYTEF